MRTKKHYEKMLSENPNTSVGYTLAADMVFAARHDIINRAEAHGTDEWRTIARNLKSRYGENLSVDQIRHEMKNPKTKDLILRRIPEDVHRAFKTKCAMNGVGMTEKIIEFMRKEVAG